MRKILSLSLLLLCFSSNAQTLFSYGTNTVDKKEFWRAFSKNNNGATDEKAVRDYLDLFIRFKLKVQAAKEAKLDTLPNIKNDIAGFRAQMSDQFMQNNTAVKEVIAEAQDRSKTELEVAHIFVVYGFDSTAAKKQIEKAYQQLQTGADFGKTSEAFSTNEYVKSTKGYIGYISVFSLPYDIETTVYNLPVGAYSKPVAGPTGYHILKLISKRKSLGTMKAAQVLIAVPANASAADVNEAKEKAETVYKEAKAGEKFETLAFKYSNDKLSYASGGVMPEFGFTKYDPAFSKAAFNLKNDGDISEPVRLSDGFHIIKRISLKPAVENNNDAAFLQEMTEKVNADARVNVALARVKQQMKTASGFKQLPYNEKELWTLTDTTLSSKSYVTFFKANQTKPLFLLKGKTISVTDWLKYAKAQQPYHTYGSINYNKLMNQFIETTVEQYYKDRLESTNEDFRYQLKEFSEGSLLFEVMERKIWSVAPTDTVALLAYYNKNKSKYKWQPSAGAVIFNCSDTAIANKALTMMKADPTKWKEYMNDFNGTALADSGRFEMNQLPAVNGGEIKPGMFTQVVTNPNDGSASFCYVVKLFNTEDQRTFEEAKGLVINDYQLLMEEQWITQLKKKYPVKINEPVLKSLIKK